MKKIALVIPALSNNRHFENGDLVDFGDMSLLEWKLNQVSDLSDLVEIYVSTPSTKIHNLLENKNIKVILREEKISMAEVIETTLSKIDEEVIMWVNCTSPFINGATYRKMIEAYEENEETNDSLVTVLKMNEYFIYNNKALNFDIKNPISRSKLEPVYKVSNGVYIFEKEAGLKKGKLFGSNPFLFELDKFLSHEIFDVEDHSVAVDLISKYFWKEVK